MNIIYKITNLINGKIYIGSTRQNPLKRWRHHNWESSKEESQSKLHKAIRRYGKNNFKFEVIFYVLNIQDLLIMEKYFIDYFKSNIDSIGYNIHCPLTSDSNYISINMKKEWSDPKIREKRIESMIKGSKKKAIIAVSIYGDDIKQFESINHAKREGFNGSSILNSLKRRASYGQGYVWHYAEGLDNYESIYAETLRVLGDWKQRDDTAIQAFDPKTGIKVLYPSLQAIKDAGFSIKAINRSLSGRRKIAQGFIWSYL